MELRTEIEIEAPAERVWAVLTDWASYSSWNPFITEIDGPLKVGARLRVELAPPGSNRPVKYRPRLIVVEPPVELRWKGHFMVKGLFEGEHFFRLEDVGNGRVRLINAEDFSGLLAKAMTGAVTQSARGFVAMNHALRQRVLSRAPRAPARG